MEEPIWINDHSVQVDVNDSESTTNLSKMMKLTEEGLPPTAKTNFDGIVNHTFINFLDGKGHSKNNEMEGNPF